jgi:beta-glucosidase-like glycosyl hydrolase/CubicO group peptidase (beta-lactamase class C family)
MKRFLLYLGISAMFAVILAAVTKIPTKKHASQNRTTLSEEEWVKQQMTKMTTEEKIAQSFMVACWSNKGNDHLMEVSNYISEDKVGGVIFFQGEKENLAKAIATFQTKAQIPLLFGMDAEWGTAMRISDQERFPYLATVGAANDLDLTKRLGRLMGEDCAEIGINFNFAPDADVNIEPNNPVIGFRAFGNDPKNVAKHTAAFVAGMEETKVLSCIKHFPGHGDTDKDSHLELPTVSHSKEKFEAVDFPPFVSGIEAGTSAIMVAHLNVPGLDPSGTPSSLSKVVIEDVIRKQLKFKGLVVSDALNMKAVSDKYGKEDVVVKAYMAGCDVLLFPESVGASIKAIAGKVESGKITKEEVNEHCKRVLKAKYKAVFEGEKYKSAHSKNERTLVENLICEKAITVLKNEGNVLPIGRMDEEIVHISVGPYADAFHDRLNTYGKIKQLRYFTVDEAKERLKSQKFGAKTTIILDLHSVTQREKNNFGFGKWEELLPLLPEESKVALLLFGNQMVLRNTTELPTNIDACVIAHENHLAMQDRVAQFVAGAFDVNGKLETAINTKWSKGFGLAVAGNGRLKYTVPEELGISSKKMEEIDEICENAIKAKVFPGCQVVVAIEGKVIHQKSYGTMSYEDTIAINNDDLYDIASITKIASSTVSLMKLDSENKFSSESTLGTLVPEYVSGTAYANLKANDLLTHQAGLTPWIAFYKKTLKDGNLDPAIYKTKKEPGFETQVAKDIYIKDDYWKTMIKTITETPLSGQKKYEYSDLSYYFFNKYIERVSGMGQEKFVQDNIYAPLGLQHMTYLPLKKFPLKQITPTENDKEFRKQEVRGYVHDPGASMMGGVAGHAGLFSNATDLAALMQLFLNKGQIGNYSVISKAVIEKYTKCQFCPGNRRGLGFDKPSAGGGGPVSALASTASFGHSGFTGTLAWADPTYNINYVFLSNRVSPNADNWKIRDMNIRTNIQEVIYKAYNESKKKH